MFEQKLKVPKDTTQIEVVLPLPEDTLRGGPRFLQLKKGSKLVFNKLAGGPAIIKVIKVGKPSHGMKSVTVQSAKIISLIHRSVFEGEVKKKKKTK